MKYLLPGNVHDTALKRIGWLFDEFDKIAVSFSGGKDSTVVVQLALQVAREKGRLPLTVVWLDQECEHDTTVAYARELFSHPDIRARWYQIPFRLFNATAHDSAHSWLNVWGEGEEWVRDKESDSIHDNPFTADRFLECMIAIGDYEVPHGVMLTGVRAEESPARRHGLLNYATYKWATWGSRGGGSGMVYRGKLPKQHHLLMHPIYDWTYRDVWKAIYDGGWPYNRLYDFMHQYGVPHRSMRVSNYHHETAVNTLFWLQEVEPGTWERATRRVSGIATAGQLGARDWFIDDLPFMFRSWREYRDYLLQHLVTDLVQRREFRKQIEMYDRIMPYVDSEDLAKQGVQAILVNDYHSTKLMNYYITQRARYWRDQRPARQRG